MNSVITDATDQALELDDEMLCLMRSAKIMMVDDEPINMRVLQLHLNVEGYERFVSVSDSTIAMSVLRAEKPNVLLLDLNMPEVSGLEILEQIRADEELKRLPVIVLTSSNSEDIKFKALQCGANDFLPKPVHASELALRMRNTLVARSYEQRIMHVDSLTDLPNRLALADYIEQHVANNELGADSHALVLINIHRFKTINDSYGSARGDDVLWAFSQRLRLAFVEAAAEEHGSGDSVLVVRLGGDRFGVFANLLENPSAQSVLQGQLTQLLKSLEQPFAVESSDVYINVGIGASYFNTTTKTVEALISHAETAMRNHDQNSGYPCTFFSAEMTDGARRLLDIENGLRTAIEDNALYLTYQPKVDVQTGLITGAEALLRWRDAKLGELSPVEFIPVAEATNMIVPIGLWVLEQACHQAANLRRTVAPHFKIAVNVSVAQLAEPHFTDFVLAALKNSGLPSRALTLELTENMIMDDVEASIAKLAALRELGISISIDDFGTGYSSLSYLHRFSVDQLKIDRSFIMQIESLEVGSPIVKAVVMLANDLGLSIVAEGVETEIQLAYIQTLPRMEYQGYYMSRPLIATEFEKLVIVNMQKLAA